MVAEPHRLTAALPGTGGRLLARAEDFTVEEALPYPASGEGTHVFVRIEKLGLTTPEAIRRLLPGVPPRAIGYAGLKDRHAVARQWISIDDASGEVEARLVDVEDVRILETVRHQKKLKRGHVASNRFSLVLRDVHADGLERAQKIVEHLHRAGVPNLFGPQRFGRRGDNAQRARRILSGELRAPRRRDEKSIVFSALQSELFNDLVDRRLAEGTFDRALDGDIMQKHDTRGLFTVVDPAAEQPRVDDLMISATAPLFGKKTMLAEREALALEEAVLADAGLDLESVARLGAGTRRVIRFPFDPTATVEAIEPGALRITFSLPSGAYATVVLDEIVKPPDAPFTRERPERD